MPESGSNISEGKEAKRPIENSWERNYEMKLLLKRNLALTDGFLSSCTPLCPVQCHRLAIRAMVLITYRTLSLGIHVSLPLSRNQYRVC